MTFSNYKTTSEVLKAFPVIYRGANSISEITCTISEYFHEDLELMIRDTVVDNSEFVIYENPIYCVLKEFWKTYCQHFILSSRESLNHDEKLLGCPEYIQAERYSLGKVVFDKPYFILLEAEQDHFEVSWV